MSGGASTGGGGGTGGGSFRLPRPITFHGATSATFQSEVSVAAAAIPEQVWGPVVAAGVTVRGARLVSDGGILGYDDHDGAYRRSRARSPGKVVVAEYMQSPVGEVPTRDPKATLFHEFGHPAYDYVLTAWERIGFDRIARGEAWQIPHAHHGMLIHFLMPGPGRTREIFAESFATAMGRNSPDFTDFRHHFPKSVGFVEGIIIHRKAAHAILTQTPPGPGGSPTPAP